MIFNSSTVLVINYATLPIDWKSSVIPYDVYRKIVRKENHEANLLRNKKQLVRLEKKIEKLTKINIGVTDDDLKLGEFKGEKIKTINDEKYQEIIKQLQNNSENIKEMDDIIRSLKSKIEVINFMKKTSIDKSTETEDMKQNLLIDSNNSKSIKSESEELSKLKTELQQVKNSIKNLKTTNTLMEEVSSACEEQIKEQFTNTYLQRWLLVKTRFTKVHAIKDYIEFLLQTINQIGDLYLKK